MMVFRWKFLNYVDIDEEETLLILNIYLFILDTQFGLDFIVTNGRCCEQGLIDKSPAGPIQLPRKLQRL